MRGRFVVVEGGDGTGKSTQAATLVATLRARGISVYETFESDQVAKTGIVLDLLAAVLAAAWCALVVPRVLGAVG